MTAFTHRDLDGVYGRLLGPAVLETRDPNDGQSSDPADKRRHQYTLCNGILLSRVLPAESVGDTWIDPETGRPSKRPPLWESIETPRHWPLLVAWIDHALGDSQPRNWSMGGSAAWGQRANGVAMLTMRSLIEVTGTDWPQSFACPHCHGWIVWAEAGYVPGYRICSGCHRHWRIVESETIASAYPFPREGWPEIVRWTLRRAKGHGWPYGEDAP